MKYTIILFLIFILTNINCQNTKLRNTNDLELSSLNGEVNTITLAKYKFSEIENKDTSYLSKMQYRYLEKKYVSRYNMNGFITESIEYNWSGSVDNHIWYQYSPNNKLLIGPEGEYSYDKTGKLYMTTFTNSQNGLKKSTKYFYDSKDRLAEKYVYDYDGELNYHFSYKYDSNDLLTESRYRYYGNALTFRVNEKKEYYYDSANNLIMIKTSGVNTDYYEIQELKYNERKDIILQKITGSLEDKDLTYSYSYDSMFNWIRKEEYLNGELVLLEERIIEYYP